LSNGPGGWCRAAECAAAGPLILDSPSIGPGKSTTLKWTTKFLTPFDPHYTITIDGGDVPSPRTWELWTHLTFCP
jgi:hypothetical protein